MKESERNANKQKMAQEEVCRISNITYDRFKMHA